MSENGSTDSGGRWRPYKKAEPNTEQFYINMGLFKYRYRGFEISLVMGVMGLILLMAYLGAI